MNAERRKRVAKLLAQLATLKGEAEIIRDDEQEAYDNMPESIQNSERGEQSQSAIDSLEELMEAIDNAESLGEV